MSSHWPPNGGASHHVYQLAPQQQQQQQQQQQPQLPATTTTNGYQLPPISIASGGHVHGGAPPHGLQQRLQVATYPAHMTHLPSSTAASYASGLTAGVGVEQTSYSAPPALMNGYHAAAHPHPHPQQHHPNSGATGYGASDTSLYSSASSFLSSSVPVSSMASTSMAVMAPNPTLTSAGSLSPPDRTSSSLIGGSKEKRKQVKNACTNCQKACKKCDEGRPCSRCVKYDLQSSCENSTRKERLRGIKRGPYKRRTHHFGVQTSAGGTSASSATTGGRLVAPGSIQTQVQPHAVQQQQQQQADAYTSHAARPKMEPRTSSQSYLHFTSDTSSFLDRTNSHTSSNSSSGGHGHGHNHSHGGSSKSLPPLLSPSALYHAATGGPATSPNLTHFLHGGANSAGNPADHSLYYVSRASQSASALVHAPGSAQNQQQHVQQQQHQQHHRYQSDSSLATLSSAGFHAQGAGSVSSGNSSGGSAASVLTPQTPVGPETSLSLPLPHSLPLPGTSSSVTTAPPGSVVQQATATTPNLLPDPAAANLIPPSQGVEPSTGLPKPFPLRMPAGVAVRHRQQQQQSPQQQQLQMQQVQGKQSFPSAMSPDGLQFDSELPAFLAHSAASAPAYQNGHRWGYL